MVSLAFLHIWHHADFASWSLILEVKKFNREFIEASIGLCFFLQEMPACAIDDAYVPI